MDTISVTSDQDFLDCKCGSQVDLTDPDNFQPESTWKGEHPIMVCPSCKHVAKLVAELSA